MKYNKLALLLVCSLASGLGLSACSTPVDDCTHGEKACRDGAVQICNHGAWLNLEVCDATKPVCDPVNFVCTSGTTSCTDADNKCENGVLSRCSNGFLYQQTCANSNQVCGTDALGQPACVFSDAPQTCMPTCVNGVYTGCNANGTAMAPVNCADAGMVCGTGTDGKPACIANQVPVTCEPTCVNGVYTGCNANGTAMVPVNCADSGKVCGTGTDGKPACIANQVPVTCEPTCVNGVYTGCNADGTAMAPVSCADAGMVCGTGTDGKPACVEDDTPVTCTPSCANDVYTGCNADGTAMAPVNCANADQVCTAAGCVDCLEDDIKCVVEDGIHNLYTCTAQNTWGAAEACTDGKVCDTSSDNPGCVTVASGLTCPPDVFFTCQTFEGKEWAVFCEDGEVLDEYTEACEDGSYCDEDLYSCTEAVSCGNGMIDADEDCDLENLNNKTCASVLGSYSATGTLKCTSGCKFDTTECVDYYCGNGILEDYEIFGQPGETCDDKDFGGLTCTTYKNDGKTYTGSLACTSECGIDDSGCVVEEIVVPNTYTKIKDIRSNYSNIVSVDSSNKCTIVADEAAKSVNLKGLVTGVSSSGGKKGTFFVQGDDASDNAAIPVYCKEDCNVSVTNLSDLEGKVVTVSGTGVMGLYGCGLQLVHTSSKPVVLTVVTDTVNVTPKTLKIADIGVNTPSTPYAGMLLKVEGLKLSSDSKYLTQGTDKIEPSGYIYKHTWTAGATYSSVTGVLHYVAAGYLASRRASDIVEAAPCVGECKNNMYYACVDGVLSTSGTGQPTTANGSYTCDVNKGWVLSCDTGYKPNTSNDGCVEASSGGGKTITVDFTADCNASTNCSKSGSGYSAIRTYTIDGVTIVATGSYDSSHPGITLTGSTEHSEYVGIVVSGLTGVKNVSFVHSPYNPQGDKVGVVTVGSVNDEFDISTAGTFSKDYNDSSATGLTVKSKKGSKKDNKQNRYTISSLTVTTP